jgi:hypothetical protein
MALSQDNRRTLTDRVERQVAGRGIPRRHIEDVVDRVARVLDARLPDPASSRASLTGAGDADGAAGPRGDGQILAVLSASVMPDLASRTRRALAEDGLAVSHSGSASEGRHTVVTLRMPASSETLVRRVAAQLGAACTIQRDGGGDR